MYVILGLIIGFLIGYLFGIRKKTHIQISGDNSSQVQVSSTDDSVR